jgi:omega-6 fatty acid desaturase (delta-12 desaturase)
LTTPIGDVSHWRNALGKYRTPRVSRALYELVITAVPFVLCWYAMYWALMHSQMWLYTLLIVPTAGFVIRLFLIQHDCGHGAFFANRRANDWTGRLISILTLTPYDHWRRAHSIHHATSGNLNRRGVGDVDTLTVAEYRARSRLTRLRYRAYRHPAVMFVIGPVFVFLFQNRLPAGFMRQWRPWFSTMATNVAMLAVAVPVVWAIGLKAFLIVHLPVVLVAAFIGVWLFYVQHQFEQTYWAKGAEWNLRDAALQGSSHYDLPPVLRWFTANIGVHHVHHLSSRIPFYRLPDVLTDYPELRTLGRVTFWQSIKSVRLVLWDENAHRLISFKELRRLA